MLKQEFQTHLHTQANIQMWRHAAIAISQQHLRQAKFRKDFDIGAGPAATWNDAQACHAADLAASVYTRISSSSLSLKRKALSNMFPNRVKKRAVARSEASSSKPCNF
jgi:hypothetical protein